MITTTHPVYARTVYVLFYQESNLQWHCSASDIASFTNQKHSRCLPKQSTAFFCGNYAVHYDWKFVIDFTFMLPRYWLECIILCMLLYIKKNEYEPVLKALYKMNKKSFSLMKESVQRWKAVRCLENLPTPPTLSFTSSTSELWILSICSHFHCAIC